MSRKIENTGFTCTHCGAVVAALINGSYRNHCPCCLHSLHIDNTPGDRASNCLGLMMPVGVHYHSKKGYQVIHRCQKCGAKKRNRAAPDDIDALISIMKGAI